MSIELSIWKGKAVENGEYISDRRMIFKRSSVVNKRLLEELENTTGTNISIKPQAKAKEIFDLLEKDTKQILDFDSYICFKENPKGGMLFTDCFRDKWQIQKPYYELVKKLLGFDYLLGGTRVVGFVKNSEIIGLLMCFF